MSRERFFENTKISTISRERPNNKLSGRAGRIKILVGLELNITCSGNTVVHYLYRVKALITKLFINKWSEESGEEEGTCRKYKAILCEGWILYV